VKTPALDSGKKRRENELTRKRPQEDKMDEKQKSREKRGKRERKNTNKIWES